MAMIVLPINERIGDQLAELCAHYGLDEVETVLSAIQREYIRMLDFKKTDAEDALYASWLESEEFDDPFEEELPI